MQPRQVGELKRLQLENARLRKPLAERDLELEAMREVAVKGGKRAEPHGRGAVRENPALREPQARSSSLTPGAPATAGEKAQKTSDRDPHSLTPGHRYVGE